MMSNYGLNLLFSFKLFIFQYDTLKKSWVLVKFWSKKIPSDLDESVYGDFSKFVIDPWYPWFNLFADIIMYEWADVNKTLLICPNNGSHKVKPTRMATHMVRV